MSIHVEIISNHGRKPSILLRRAWREGKRIRKEQLANLTRTPAFIVDGIRAMLKGGTVVNDIAEVLAVSRSLPHGHVCAALAVCRRLGLGEVTGNEMLAMLDWLVSRQRWIERSLANRHLRGGTLILYDVSSSRLEGRKCPLAAFGHSRDGKRGKKQITYGLLCAADGCPAAVEVFAGNTADPSTVASQVAKVRERFGIGRVALVGDRGMLTAARIREDLGPAGLD